jgi:hypothetical protein
MKVLVIQSEFMGSGDADLGKELMGSFLRRLCGANNRPDTVIFYNSGVKLLGAASGVLDALTLLQERGVNLVACGTCLLHYGLGKEVAPEVIGDMRGIVDFLFQADDVITL